MADVQPNIYELSGNGLQVYYSPINFGPAAVFTYHDVYQAKEFRGDEIKVEHSLAGTLVTVFLMRVADGPSTSFTLLLPNFQLKINPPMTSGAAITTIGITTLHRSTIVGPPEGQTDFYTVHPLQGTVKLMFP